MVDYHLHSDISGDSNEKMSAICEYAIKKGMREICFTEHIDVDYPYDDAVFTLDFDEYGRQYEGILKRYPELSIKKGLEAGLMPDVIEKTNELIGNRQFDFIIASQHVVVGEDAYYGNFFDKRTKRKAYTIYLEELYKCIKLFDNFNVIGHLGFPSKFCTEQEKRMEYRDYGDIIDEILKHLIYNGKGIEVNTSGFDATGEDLPAKSIIKRYRELKGDIITIGSDAHTKERIGYRFKTVVDYLKEMGFSYICTFDKRKCGFLKI